MGSLILRALQEEDIPALRTLAHDLWRTHYTPIIGEAQVEYMLGKLFTLDALSRQRKEGELTYLVAEEAGALHGFIAWREEVRARIIDKFYVGSDHQRKGAGTMLLPYAEAAPAKPEKLQLRVNRYNESSIKYYLHRGFAIKTSVDSPFGPFTLNDYVMVKRL